MPITGSIDATDLIKNLGDDTHGLRPSGLEVNREAREGKQEHIYRATYRGPVDISTSTSITRRDPIVWDVNFYYRSLGIEWPYKPSKKELRLGYQEHGGPDDERLTYHFKQLLDPDVRRAYDATPLGNRFRDKYVVEEDMRNLADYASELSEESGELVTISDLLEEHEKTKPTPPPELEDDVIRWMWGFYLLNSRKFETENLQLWQGFLISALSRRGVQRKISIGYVGNTKKPYIVKQHEGRVIFFLNEKIEPTMELAQRATAPRKSRSRSRK